MQPAHQPFFIDDRIIERHFECMNEVDFPPVPTAGIERAAYDGINSNRRRRNLQPRRQPIEQFILRLIEAEFDVADI